MNVSVTNDSGNVVIQNQPLYIYDYMYDEMVCWILKY